jgi:hypothetical protein
MKDDEIKARLNITDMQLEMAYYSGALPKNIDQELFLDFWERKLVKRRAEIRPKVTIYDEPI